MSFLNGAAPNTYLNSYNLVAYAILIPCKNYVRSSVRFKNIFVSEVNNKNEK
jgi:hypothetical protein